MIEFTFEVNGQGLRRTDRVNPAGDVVGQLWAVFEFDDWWEDTFPIARFMKSGVIYDVEIIDDRCLVPYQALSGEGKFYVTVYAVVPSGRSPPARGCGLKSDKHFLQVCTHMSPPARGCGLK